jgi:tetratricopeptide (TPR) repeat protein
MEFRVAQYTAYQEALKNPEDFSKRDEFIGKAAAASIPIGVSLAIALGFEVAIPLFLAQSVNWATILSSVALGEAADFAVQKGMDKLEINNPALRIGASMVAGILAGGLVTGVSNKIKNIERLEVERLAEEAEQLAKEKTEQLANEKAKQVAKEESERLIREANERELKEQSERKIKEEAKLAAQEKAKELAKLESKRKATEESIKSYDEILKADPENAIAWRERGSAFLSLKDTEKDINKQAGNMSSLSAIFLRYNQAIESFDKSLKINPKDIVTWQLKSHALFNSGQYPKALASYGKVLKLKPGDPYATEQMGTIYYSLGKWEKAVKFYDEVIDNKLNPHFDKGIFFNKGIALERSGMFKEAVESFDEFLRFTPKGDSEVFPKYCKADALFKLGRFEECIETLEGIKESPIINQKAVSELIDSASEKIKSVKSVDKQPIDNFVRGLEKQANETGEGWLTRVTREISPQLYKNHEVLEAKLLGMDKLFTKSLTTDQFLEEMSNVVESFDVTLMFKGIEVPNNYFALVLHGRGMYKEALNKLAELESSLDGFIQGGLKEKEATPESIEYIRSQLLLKIKSTKEKIISELKQREISDEDLYKSFS